MNNEKVDGVLVRGQIIGTEDCCNCPPKVEYKTADLCKSCCPEDDFCCQNPGHPDCDPCPPNDFCCENPTSLRCQDEDDDDLCEGANCDDEDDDEDECQGEDCEDDGSEDECLESPCTDDPPTEDPCETQDCSPPDDDPEPPVMTRYDCIRGECVRRPNGRYFNPVCNGDCKESKIWNCGEGNETCYECIEETCFSITNNLINEINDRYAQRGLSNPFVYYSSRSACEFVCNKQFYYRCSEVEFINSSEPACVRTTKEFAEYLTPDCNNNCQSTEEGFVAINISWTGENGFQDLDTSCEYLGTRLGYDCEGDPIDSFTWITNDVVEGTGVESYYIRYYNNTPIKIGWGWFEPANREVLEEGKSSPITVQIIKDGIEVENRTYDVAQSQLGCAETRYTYNG